jgi:hypothetical protein
MFEKMKCKKLLKSQRSRLQEMKGILERYSNLPQNPKLVLKALVDFFDEMSEFQDQGYFNVGNSIKMQKYFPNAYKELSIINSHLSNSGRCTYGFNRTSVGQQVTAKNVYLGDIYGIFTFTVEKWINETPEENTHMDIIDKSTNKPIWLTKLIAEYQAGPFIKSHLRAIENINKVISIAATC